MSRYLDAICCPKVVLLIDDCEDDRMLFRAACEGLNIELVEAPSGRDGLNTLKERPDIDLVLVDARMPGMCGLDVYRKMRERGDKHQVVFWTGHAGELAKKLRNEGCARVIEKPSRINRCFVQDLLSQFGVREQLHEIAPA